MKLYTNVGELETVRRGGRAVSELLQSRSLVGYLRKTEAKLQRTLEAVNLERARAHSLLDRASVEELRRELSGSRIALQAAQENGNHRKGTAGGRGGVGGAGDDELAKLVRPFANGPPFIQWLANMNTNKNSSATLPCAQTADTTIVAGGGRRYDRRRQRGGNGDAAIVQSVSGGEGGGGGGGGGVLGGGGGGLSATEEGVHAAVSKLRAARENATAAARNLKQLEAKARATEERRVQLHREFAALKPTADAVPTRVAAKRAEMVAMVSRLEAERSAARAARGRRKDDTLRTLRESSAEVWRGRVEAATREHSAASAELDRQLSPTHLSAAAGAAAVRATYRGHIREVEADTAASSAANKMLAKTLDGTRAASLRLKTRRDAPRMRLRAAVAARDSVALECAIDAAFAAQRFARSKAALHRATRELALLKRRAAQPVASVRDAAVQRLERAFPRAEVDDVISALLSTGFVVARAHVLSFYQLLDYALRLSYFKMVYDYYYSIYIQGTTRRPPLRR